ncbi:MAG: heme-binding protein [Methylococcaceae bacterium]
MKKTKTFINILEVVALSMASQTALATCDDIVAAFTPVAPLVLAVVGAPDNGGYGLPMWVAAVDETGKVCGIINSAGSGAAIGNKSWLGSRVIAVQKATTANAFSLDAFSISTANLYGLTQPGGSLYGLQHSNPVDASIAYLGSPDTYGTGNDPLVGQRVGGVNVFGGGLALYNGQGIKIGAIGVSGDTSCTDHAVAWKIRHVLALDNVPGGFVSGYTPAPSFAVLGDEMIIGAGDVANTYKQVSCAHNAINNPTAGAATGVIIE